MPWEMSEEKKSTVQEDIIGRELFNMEVRARYFTTGNGTQVVPDCEEWITKIRVR